MSLRDSFRTPGGAAPANALTPPSFVTMAPAAKAKLLRKRELARTAQLVGVVVGDSNSTPGNFNDTTWTEGNPTRLLDQKLQALRNNDPAGPQNDPFQLFFVKVGTMGNDAVNSPTDTPWHPDNGKWFGDRLITLGPSLSPSRTTGGWTHFMGPTVSDRYMGWVVDRTATGKDYEVNKTKVAVKYSVRGNVDQSIASGGSQVDQDGVTYSGGAFSGYYSSFLLELVDITGVAEADYDTTAAYASQVIEPRFGTGASLPGVVSPFLGTITDGIQTLVRLRPIAGQSQLVAWSGTPTAGTRTFTYGGNTTSALAYNASSGTIRTALEALPSIGAGNIAVNSLGTGFIFNFQGTMNGAARTAFTATDSITGATTVISQTSMGSIFEGLILTDDLSTGVGVLDHAFSGASDDSLEYNRKSALGVNDATFGVPGFSRDYYARTSASTKIYMYLRNEYNQSDFTNFATYAALSHTVIGLDFVCHALTINNIGNDVDDMPAKLQALLTENVSRLDALTGNDEVVYFVVIPPCIAGDEDERDEYYDGSGDARTSWSEVAQAYYNVQALYPGTVIIVDCQKMLGDLSPTEVKERIGHMGTYMAEADDPIDPLHFKPHAYQARWTEHVARCFDTYCYS
ncbi:MAG TPA: hypothetical protein VK171_11745 [Fimbriimonas sp.]|nr:hypothetical protein [Fimbriimonas sp.]